MKIWSHHLALEQKIKIQFHQTFLLAHSSQLSKRCRILWVCWRTSGCAVQNANKWHCPSLPCLLSWQSREPALSRASLSNQQLYVFYYAGAPPCDLASAGYPQNHSWGSRLWACVWCRKWFPILSPEWEALDTWHSSGATHHRMRAAQNQTPQHVFIFSSSCMKTSNIHAYGSGNTRRMHHYTTIRQHSDCCHTSAWELDREVW